MYRYKQQMVTNGEVIATLYIYIYKYIQFAEDVYIKSRRNKEMYKIDNVLQREVNGLSISDGLFLGQNTNIIRNRSKSEQTLSYIKKALLKV